MALTYMFEVALDAALAGIPHRLDWAEESYGPHCFNHEEDQMGSLRDALRKHVMIERANTELQAARDRMQEAAVLFDMAGEERIAGTLRGVLWTIKGIEDKS